MQHPESFENGRYAVIQLLGEGGMARVYLAADTRLRRVVAIKVPKPNLLLFENVIRRFAQEVVSMARATHPFVVTLYEAGAERLANGVRTPYLVMELVRGVNAEEIYLHGSKDRFGTLSPRLAARIILQVLSALEELHACGLIHRDIKPSNIMLGWNPNVVKLMDFGIARVTQDAIDDGERQTKTIGAMGSPAFSAPEQMKCAKDADERADLYAVATTLYGLLTGKGPEDLCVQSIDDPEFQSVPECLRSVIYGATRYKRDERAYRTAKEMADAISHAIRDEPETDERAFRAWLDGRRETSNVEAAISRAFGVGYTLIPEITEGKSADDYVNLCEEGRTPQTILPEEPAVRRRPLAWIAGASFVAFAATALGIAVVQSRRPIADVAPTLSNASSDEISTFVSLPIVHDSRDTDSDPSGMPEAESEPVRSSSRRLIRSQGKNVLVLPEAATVSEAVVEPVPEPVPEPTPAKGTVLLGGGATSLSLVSVDGTVYPAGRILPGTYRMQAVFPKNGTASSAGTVTVAAGETVTVTCNETFKLCNAM